MVQQFQERTDGEMMVNSVDLEHMIKYIKQVQGYPSFRLTHFGPTMTKWSFLSPGIFGMLDFLPFQNVSSKFCRLAFGFINLQEISRNLENNISKTWICPKKKTIKGTSCIPNPWRIHGAAIYGVPWIPSICPSHVSIYTSTMDPMGNRFPLQWIQVDSPCHRKSWRSGDRATDLSRTAFNSTGSWLLHPPELLV